MSADIKIRARAILMLMRQGVEFDKNVSNSTLIALGRLSRQAIKDEKDKK